MFQSTPLREGRLLHTNIRYVTVRVSIHAPARGATVGVIVEQLVSEVSIHAPARGATCHTTGNATHHACFNPRPCARGDVYIPCQRVVFAGFQSTPLREGRLSDSSFSGSMIFVSIHAPARGATSGLISELR